MKEITILSGKGGTGKTTITAALASCASNAIFCDCDVDAADLHLIFQPQISESNKSSSGWSMSINNEECSLCNECILNCRFDAISKSGKGDLIINPFICEGCRLCERVCPNSAISSEHNFNNQYFVSSTRFGILVHAKMVPGEEKSGKLVMEVRQRAKKIANIENTEFVISDGPPGIGCATISSLSGTNTVLLVIEPTKSGMHDSERLIKLVESFNITVYSIINKYDLDESISKEIEGFLAEKRIPLLAKIPFDKEVVEAMVNGLSISEYKPDSIITRKIKEVWKTIQI